jgi:hypothetical protein
MNRSTIRTKKWRNSNRNGKGCSPKSNTRKYLRNRDWNSWIALRKHWIDSVSKVSSRDWKRSTKCSSYLQNLTSLAPLNSLDSLCFSASNKWIIYLEFWFKKDDELYVCWLWRSIVYRKITGSNPVTITFFIFAKKIFKYDEIIMKNANH